MNNDWIAQFNSVLAEKDGQALSKVEFEARYWDWHWKVMEPAAFMAASVFEAAGLKVHPLTSGKVTYIEVQATHAYPNNKYKSIKINMGLVLRWREGPILGPGELSCSCSDGYDGDTLGSTDRVKLSDNWDDVFKLTSSDVADVILGQVYKKFKEHI